MSNEIYIFRNKQIQENDLELTFHKDVFWIYNPDPFPVIKFRLTNCKNINTIDFSDLDYYNDGVQISTDQINSTVFQFETTDMGGRKKTILCNSIERIEEAYSKDDFVYLIGEIIKQRDEENSRFNKMSEKFAELKKNLSHELDTIERKINQAKWLIDSKKNYLKGKQDVLKYIIEKLEE